jgi:AraC-like DNA-binding protein
MVGSRRAVLLDSQNVPLFVGHVRERGGDADAIIRQFELGASIEQATAARLPLPALHEFGRRCAEAVSDPNFGVATAAWAPRGSFGLVEYVCRSAATLGNALEQLARYHTLFGDPARVRFDSGPGYRCLSYELVGEPLCWGRHLNECCFALLCRIAREVSGGICIPKRVWFAHSEPQDTRPVRDGLSCDDVSFGCGVNAVAFSNDVLDVALLTADPALLRTLEDQVAPRLAPSTSSSDFLQALRARVQRTLCTEVRIEVVAAQLKMSSRTLQRRLAEEGTSFQDLVDAVRQAEARTLLRETDRSIKDIARALGYSETSAFVRAYKRATGSTPGEARRCHSQPAT